MPRRAPPLLKTARHLVVVDLESTVADGRRVKESGRETIELGAVRVRLDTLEETGRFQAFVRPVRHPKLLRLVTKITGIRQADVDGAEAFPAVWSDFVVDLLQPGHDVVWGSWSTYDLTQLHRDLAHHGLPSVLPPHVDLRREFSKALGTKKAFGVKSALAEIGLTMDGSAHRALDDAVATARLLPTLLGRTSG